MTGAWSEIGTPAKSDKGNTGGRFVRHEDGWPVQVRFVLEPKRFLRYYRDGKGAICADRETCAVHKKWGMEPELRYVVQVIDRADKLLKIFDCSPSVLKPVCAWGERHGCNPSDPMQGADFSITRWGQKRATRYDVIPMGPSPLTEKETAMIAVTKYDLDKLCRPTPDNEIEEALGLVGLGAGKNKGR